MGCRYLSTVEVNYFSLQDLLHLVHLQVVAYLDEPVVDLAQVYFVSDLRSGLSAKTALVGLSSQELLAVGRSVCYVEDIAQNGCSRHIYPVKFLTGIDEPIVHSFWLVSTSACSEFIDVVNYFMSICEVLDLSDVRGVLGWVVAVGDNSEPKSDSLCPNFVLNLLDDSHDGGLHLS